MHNTATNQQIQSSRSGKHGDRLFELGLGQIVCRLSVCGSTRVTHPDEKQGDRWEARAGLHRACGLLLVYRYTPGQLSCSLIRGSTFKSATQVPMGTMISARVSSGRIMNLYFLLVDVNTPSSSTTLLRLFGLSHDLCCLLFRISAMELRKAQTTGSA